MDNKSEDWDIYEREKRFAEINANADAHTGIYPGMRDEFDWLREEVHRLNLELEARGEFVTELAAFRRKLSEEYDD